MSFFDDLARATKAGRRAVRQIQGAVQAVERGAADVQSVAGAISNAAEEVKSAGAGVRRVLSHAEEAISGAGKPAPRRVSVGTSAGPRKGSAPRPPAHRAAGEVEVVEAEVIDFGVAPRGPR